MYISSGDDCHASAATCDCRQERLEAVQLHVPFIAKETSFDCKTNVSGISE